MAAALSASQPVPLDQVDPAQLTSLETEAAPPIPADQIDVSQLTPVEEPGIPLDQIDPKSLLTQGDYLRSIPRNQILDEAAKVADSGGDVSEYRRAYVDRAKEKTIFDEDRSGQQKPGGNVQGLGLEALIGADSDPKNTSLIEAGAQGLSSFLESGFKLVDNLTLAGTGRGIVSGVSLPVRTVDGVLNPEQNRVAGQAVDESRAGVQVGTAESLMMLWDGTNRLLNKLRTGPHTPADEESYSQQFEDGLSFRQWKEKATRGEKIEAALGGKVTVDPESVQQIAPAGDLSNWIPLTAGARAGRAVVAANRLEEMAKAGILSRGAAKMAETTAAGLRATERAISDNPLIHGIAAAVAAEAVGADPSQAILAGLLGANVKSTGIARATVGRAASALEKTQGQLLGRIPPGPIGLFAASAAETLAPELKAVAMGQLANTPFLLGAGDEDQFKTMAATGVALHAAGYGVGKAVNGLQIGSNYFSAGKRTPEIRMEVKDYGVDPALDLAHQQVASKLTNASNNFLQGVRDFFKKERGELYTLNEADYAKYLDSLVGKQIVTETGKTVTVTPEMANLTKRQQGVTLQIPGEDGTVRNVALSRVTEALPGLSAGHEAGHLLARLLSDEERTNILERTRKYYGDEQLAEYWKRYQDMVDSRGEVPLKTVSEMTPEELKGVVEEVFAEHVSAVFNSIPIGKFGIGDGKRDYAREVYGMIGRGLEKIGVKQPELAPDYAPKTPVTGTGIEPSMRLSQLVENIIQAKRLDGMLPGQKEPILAQPGVAPDVEAKPAATAAPKATDIADAKPVVEKAQPGLKKGDPVDEVRNADGVLLAENAKILKELGEVGGVKYFEIEYTHPDSGVRMTGNVPEAWLQSKVAPGGATPTSYPHPITGETPAGAFTKPTGAKGIVAPKQVENVVRPEGTSPNVRTNATAQNEFAKPAEDPVHKANREVLDTILSGPRADRPAVETDYYSAKSPVQAPDATVREGQRKAADAAEKDGKVNPLRAIYQKVFVPLRWTPWKLDEATSLRLYGDAPRPAGGVFGMSLDKVIQNVDLLRGALQLNPKAEKVLAGYGVDAAYLSSPKLRTDLQAYLENQSHGYAGDGTKLVRPGDAREGSITPEDPSFNPRRLPPATMQAINLLMGLEQQESRTAGMEFAARFAELNGVVPKQVGLDSKLRPLVDTNSLRADLKAAGFDPRILNTAIENLPTKNFTTPLKIRSDLKFPAGDTAMMASGFMPDTMRKRVAVDDLPRETQWDIASWLQENVPSLAEMTPEEVRSNLVGLVDAPHVVVRDISPGAVKMSAKRGISDVAVSNYAKLRGENAPPIVTDGDRLLEGGHRLTAARRRNDATISAVDIGPLIRQDWKAYLTDGPLPSELSAKFMPETGPSSVRRSRGNDTTRDIAARYIRSSGIENDPHSKYATIDESRMKRIADLYESAKHEPNNPEVQKAYTALADETLAQYKAMTDAGITVEPYTGKGEPYANSTGMMQDVRDNKHLYFLKTEGNFGDGSPGADNPLLADSGITAGGQKLLVNDVFRAVHDFFGHTAEGYEFGPRGEYNAYLAHSRMFTDAAKPALAAETLGQNAWVNFGPQLRRADGSLPRPGEQGYVAPKDRRFADQKTTIIPPEILGEVDDHGRAASYMPAPKTDTPEFKKWFGDWEDPKAFTARAKGPVSMVVDGQGRPLRVFHSTRNDFTQFETGRKTKNSWALGSWDTERHAAFFSDDPAFAGEYTSDAESGRPLPGARTVPVYLDIKSPADFTRMDLYTIAEEAGINPRWATSKQEHWELFDGPEGKEFVDGLKKAGYDGAIFTENNNDRDSRTTYAVFEPAQVKSASGNRGTFDASNPDIRYMPAGKVDSPEFKKWFGASKAVDKNGSPLHVYHGTQADFTAFDPNKSGSATKSRTTELGLFFTDNPYAASNFAQGDGGRVLPVVLSLQNPFEIGYRTVGERQRALKDPFIAVRDAIAKVAGKESWSSVTREDVRNWRGKLEGMGFDGIIVRNTLMDASPRTIDNPYHDFFVAFRPEQVKSATANVGTFDASNPDIRYMPAPGGAKEQKQSPTGWVLPGGRYIGAKADAQGRFLNSGDFHGNHLVENADEYKKKFGLTEPDRLEALKKGFVRVRYDGNTGRIGVEALSPFRGRERAAVEQVIEDNIDRIDRVDVNLFDRRGNLVDQNSASIFRLDGQEKSAAALEALSFMPEEAKPDLVKDGRGRPVKLYHGTREDFTKFRTGRSGLIFLSDNRDYSEHYAGHNSKVKELFAAAKNVADLDRDPKARKIAIDNFNESNFRNTDDGFSDKFDPKNDETWELSESPTFVEAMRAAGYDAAVFKETSSDGTVEGRTYALFDPEQVRDRTGAKFMPDTGAESDQATLKTFTPKNIHELPQKTDWAILSAENPGAKKLNPEENSKRTAALWDDLEAAGYDATPARGKYGNEENSFIVAGIPPEAALELARTYGQESVLLPQGNTYLDGSYNPTTGDITVHKTAPADFYTHLPKTDTYFTLGVDFDTTVPAPEAKPALADETVAAPRKALEAVGETVGVSTAKIRAGEENLEVNGSNVLEVGRALAARSRQLKRIPYDSRTTAAKDVISRTLNDEIEFARAQNGNAIGWYEHKITEALDTLAELHPEIKADPDQGSLYKAILAITSNGQAVVENFKRAEYQYSKYKATGKLDVTSDWGGARKHQINGSLETLQRLVDRHGLPATALLLNTKFTIGELKKVAEKYGVEGTIGSGEKVDHVVYGSTIFGPKVGGGFYPNLQGDFSPVTMDLWLMRTWNRINGSYGVKDPGAMAKALADLREAAEANPDSPIATEISGLSDRQLGNWADKRYSAWIKAQFKNGTPFDRPAKRFAEAKEGRQESPRNGSERAFVREVFAEIDRLRKEAKLPVINNADKQALLWYYEKDLYAHFGVRDKKSAPADYATAARQIVDSKRLPQ